MRETQNSSTSGMGLEMKFWYASTFSQMWYARTCHLTSLSHLLTSLFLLIASHLHRSDECKLDCNGGSHIESIAHRRVDHVESELNAYLESQRKIKDKLDTLQLKIRDLELNVEVRRPPALSPPRIATHFFAAFR